LLFKGTATIAYLDLTYTVRLIASDGYKEISQDFLLNFYDQPPEFRPNIPTL